MTMENMYFPSAERTTFKIPVDLVGHKIRVKVFSKDADRFAEASASSTVEGMNGSISISGIAVVGKVVKAAFIQERKMSQEYRGIAEQLKFLVQTAEHIL